MRAYLRLDPHMPDRKSSYPDGAFRAFVECLTFAEQQPNRGRFRNEKLLKVLLEKRARWVSYLVSHQDLVRLPTGELYLDGWDEWQEGDVTVPERMHRLRNRKREGVTPTVTPSVTPPTVTAPSSGGGKRLAEAYSGGGAPYQNGGARPLSKKERETALADNLRLMNDPNTPAIARRAAESTVARLRKGAA